MPEDVVLVTGASGYIGSHVVANLLARGMHVRAAARDPGRTEHLLQLPVSDEGSLEVVSMDLFDTDSVNAAVAGCSDVIHTAAAVRVVAKNPQRDIVDPSVVGCQNLVAAIDAAGCVERFVHTSSTAAISSSDFEDGHMFTSDDWCDDASVKFNPYGLAKASAERVVRDWHEQAENPPRLVTIHPSVTLGVPMTQRHLRGSLSYIVALIERSPPLLLPLHVNIVDVRDVAEAHVRALTGGQPGGRYLVVGGHAWFRDIAKVLEDEFPDRKWPRRLIPYRLALLAALFHPKITVSWAKAHLRKQSFFDASPAERELGMEWRPIEQSIIDTVRPILENDWI
ncbi:MAG: hypothetical protein CXX71_05345 [Methanobacteriota archaeon]|nr:MAG: hypothetical protein CXX71_05345 [Euryarchaeota archaeon]